MWRARENRNNATKLSSGREVLLEESSVRSARYSLPIADFLVNMDLFDLERNWNKLVKLYHAAHCTYEGGGDCPNVLYCCASKRLFQHMSTCITDCSVPGCKKCRKIWKHYRKCRLSTCPLCSAVPAHYCRKAWSNRFKKNVNVNIPSSNYTVLTDHRIDGGGSVSLFEDREEERMDASFLYSLPDKENSGMSIHQMSLGPNSIMASPEKSSNRLPLSPRRPI